MFLSPGVIMEEDDHAIHGTAELSTSNRKVQARRRSYFLIVNGIGMVQCGISLARWIFFKFYLIVLVPRIGHRYLLRYIIY
jgi:hypothetical protein